MIKYSRENRKYFLRKSSQWITIVGTEPLLIRANSSYDIETGISFWLDGGTVGLLIEASLPPVLRITNKSIRGKTKLIISVYNTSHEDVILSSPIEICYVIPLASAYFTNIEIEEIDSAWFTAGNSITEI